MMDFAEVGSDITLHGLGFIQLKLGGGQRLHVWHPDLPRRQNAAESPVHNHRFSFTSTVLVGEQVNRRYKVWDNPEGYHDLISHNGPRRPNGSRESFVEKRVNILGLLEERYAAGESYFMPMLEYHETPNSGMVATLMKKVEEGTVHAHSVTRHGVPFDQEFDRFQWGDDQLWAVVREVLSS